MHLIKNNKDAVGNTGKHRCEPHVLRVAGIIHIVNKFIRGSKVIRNGRENIDALREGGNIYDQW